MANGTMVQLAASVGELDTEDQVSLFQAYGKALVVNGSIFKVADFTNKKLTTADIRPNDVTNVAPMHGTVITATGGSASGSVMVVDYVTAANGAASVYGKVTNGAFENGDVCTGTNASGTPTAVSFTLNAAEIAGPHWYTWSSYPTIGGISSGSMPEKAYLGCLYRGRAVLAANPDYPYQWYMSRQANIFDWLYGVPDAQAAVAGQDADAGELGDVVRCLAPFRDDYLVIGCSNSVWVMRGDPASGGSLDQISFGTGVWGANSYCWDDYGFFYFFGTTGICRVNVGELTFDNLTRDVLPNLLQDEGLSHETHIVTLDYDRLNHGILIFITKLDDGTSSNYWYDLKSQGFFPESYPASCGVYSSYFYDSLEPLHRGLLMGGTNGFIRIFDDTAMNDDEDGVIETAISSYAAIGPGLIGPDPDSYGRMKAMAITTGTDTHSVDYDVYVADTAEEVVDAMQAESTPLHTGTISAGNRVKTIRARSRGIWMGLRLKNENASETWQFEKVVADIKPSGTV